MKLSRLLIITMVIAVLISGVSLVTAQSDSNGLIWNATYYNNSYLGEPAVLSRQESSIAFNWGNDSPDNIVNSDYFSARFTASFTFTDPFYRFQVVADDGVRVIIDNSITVIDTFDDPQPNQRIIADVDMAPGVHNIQVDYREVTGLASLRVGWIPVNNPGSTIRVPAANTGVTIIDTNPISPASDWTARYYANDNLSGSPSAILSESTPAHNWGTGSPFPGMPTDNFSAQWTGTFYLNGVYDITVRADDGVRVLVDGVSYINEWHLATTDTYRARFTADPGNHTIVIQYYESGGVAFLEYDLSAVSTGNVNVIPPVNTGSTSALQWLVQYYDNAGLTGTPVLTQTEDRVSRTWGYGAPLSTMSPDNFSVRFISNREFEGGTYRLRVVADDGIRVFIDGNTYIDEWHLSNGSQPYTMTVTLTPGTHNITIEYYENTEVASIEYSLDRISVAEPINDAGATATVTASLLNVRSEPNVFAPILTKIKRGETYSILGQNAAGTWIQLNVNGVPGWVNERYTDEFNYANVAITDETYVDTPNLEGYTLTTTANLNMHEGPGLEYDVIRIIPDNTVVSIEGRTIDADWWQVRYRGNVGWVTEAFVRLSPNVNYDEISVIN